MGLESATYLNDLVTTNPDGAVDAKAQGDDHLRLIKSTLKATFPGMAGRFRRIQSSGVAFNAATTDNASVVRMSASAAVNLPAVAGIGNGYELLVYNNSTGNVTLTPNGTEKINGQANLVVPPESFAIILCQTTASAEWLAFAAPMVAAGTIGTDITGNVTLTVAEINGSTRRITASAVSNTHLTLPTTSRV